MGLRDTQSLMVKSFVLSESGAKITIRKLLGFDFIDQGAVPDVLREVALEALGGELNPEKMDKESLDYLFGIICTCVLDADGMKFTSAKPPAPEGLYSLWLLPQADIGQLFSEVFKFRDGGEGPRPDRFPQEQKADGPTGPTS